MRISLHWLREYVDVAESPQELAHRLTMGGLEVSGVASIGEGIGDVVVGQILERGPHPGADRLSLCRVTDGSEAYDIVCGATNMKAGDRVALARVGARLPGGLKIQKAKIRGQVSWGMMCSEAELGLSEDHSGIMILSADSPVGERLGDVLGLPDAILEVEITPNRPDCLSVVGVAREVSALTGVDLRIPEPKVLELGDAIGNQTSVEILDPDLCHRYAARLIRGVRLVPSPQWMRQRLQSAGVRSISNVVDVTNYVLLELGHPLHAFDFARLRGGRIVVKRAQHGETFTTLDGQDRLLDAQSLLICDAVGGVALAGVMGGLNSEVADDTVDVLLESAYFLPQNIRRTSKRLGLRTEASYRFERGTDIEGLIRALDRAAELTAELAGGTVAAGIWDAYPTRSGRRQVTFRPSKAGSVLGVPVSAEETTRHLRALGVRVLEAFPETIRVEIPTHRVDLEREIDLIEEVARLRGFQSIPETLPRIPMNPDSLPSILTLADGARNALTAAGLREAITLSFVDPEEDDRLGFAEGSALRAKVRLHNPLSRETAVMRTSLLPGLLRAAGLNARRQVRDLRLYEVGRTFHPRSGDELPQEVLRASGVLVGRRHPVAWWSAGEGADFYDGKGVVESLLSRLRTPEVAFEATVDMPWLNPGRAARIRAGSEEIGWVGEMNPDRLDSYELSAPVVAFEIDLQAASRPVATFKPFAGLPRFPAVERDIAVLVDRSASYGALLDTIGSPPSPLIRSVILFDAFEGGRLPEGKVSLAFRITYRADDRTLTEAEVADLERMIVGRLADRFGARLRDS